MTERSSTLSVITAALGLSAMLLSSCAAPSQLGDSLALGRDAEGSACTANRNFHAGDLSSPFDTAYAITCEGVAASRPLGTVSVVPVAARAEESEDRCGAESTVTLSGVGPASVRRCNDKVIAAQATVIRFERSGKSYRGASSGPQTGPMTRALIALSTGNVPDGAAAEPIDIASIEPAPSPKPGFTAPGDPVFDPTIALRQGIALNLQGQNAEASRVLNDAISRNPGSTPLSIQIEFQLEAGLADSKIQFNDDAASHFSLAKSLLDANPQVDQGARLERKRTTYLAIDSLNRRDWSAAINLLATNSSRYPLEDLAVLADLNQPPRNDPSFQITATNTAELGQVALDAQRSWVASVALSSRGDPSGEKAGGQALDQAIRYVNALLNARVDPASIAWLAAQIERQSGRLAARRAERRTGAGNYADVLAKFDCALADLTGQRPANEAGCAIQMDPAARARLVATARISGPVIAETALERTTFLARSGAPEARVLADYKSAVEGLIAADHAGSLPPAGLENYLDLLAEAHTKNADPGAAEDFFRAVQAVGEPGIARQISELQAAVASGSSTTAKLLRERADLKRDIAGLRYQIADAANDPLLKGTAEEQRQAKEALSAREAERQTKEARFASIADTLQADRSLRAIDDAPVSIAEVQRPLADDEVYFKILEVRAHTYGVVIGKRRVQIYRISAFSASELASLAKQLHDSIRDESKQIPKFKVSTSYTLFQLVAGPAVDQLLAARSIVVDPGGPLGELPAGVLVTDKASVQAYAKTRERAPYDYSNVSFLAQHAALSTALSPRSFIETRALAASKAPHVLIGFGEHAPPAAGQTASGLMRIGLGCLVDRADLAAVNRANLPVSAAKLGIAATALGDPNAPEITGAAFSDTAVEARSDLDQYKVLMFATHGLPELPFGCATVPPSLLTSIGTGDSDGFLGLGEISALKLDANLVVLAACQTSSSTSKATGRRSGLEDSARSLNGLVRAFLAANARSVVATYWSVSTGEESDELFKNFYTRGRTATIGESLRAAQTELIRQPRYSHPYYWGAYFVVGDSSKSMLAGQAPVVALR